MEELNRPIVTELVSVPSSRHVAEIIGKLGCKIKALQLLTDTYIKTPVRGEKPVFIITGRPEDVAAAKHMVQADAKHITQIRAPQKNVMLSHCKVRVPYELVGLVIGPKGATVKRIQQVTNTTIVSPSHDQKDPLFYIFGQTSDSVEAAMEEIERYIEMRTGTGISISPDSLPSPVSSSPKAKSATFGGKSSSDIFKNGLLNSTLPLFRDLADTEINDMDAVHAQLCYDLDFLTMDSLDLRKTIKGQNKVCILCGVEEVVCALVPCGHNMFCLKCATDLATRWGSCPVCDAKVISKLRIYSNYT